jgi:hypothetical protein
MIRIETAIHYLHYLHWQITRGPSVGTVGKLSCENGGEAVEAAAGKSLLAIQYVGTVGPPRHLGCILGMV